MSTMADRLRSLDDDEHLLYQVIYDMFGPGGAEQAVLVEDLSARTGWDEAHVVRVMLGIQKKTGLVEEMRMAGSA